MFLKRYAKKIGRWFILLQNFSLDYQAKLNNILIVWLTHEGHIKKIVKEVKEKLPNTDIYILTSEANRDFLEKEMPYCRLILPAVNTKRFRYARQLFRFRKEGFDLVVLTKLDVSVIFAGLSYFHAPILLNNIYGEWYRIRSRMVSEIFTLSDDTKRQKLIRPLIDRKKSLIFRLIKFIYIPVIYLYLIISVTFLLIKCFITGMFKHNNMKEGV